MKVRPYIWWVIVVSGLAFVINRHVVRPALLGTEASGALMVIVYSLPNLVEAIIGSINLAGILFWMRRRSRAALARISDSILYTAIFLIAAAFTISQEMNWFNYRPDNVVDQYDLVASLVGLVLMNRLFSRFGFVEMSPRRG